MAGMRTISTQVATVLGAVSPALGKILQYEPQFWVPTQFPLAIIRINQVREDRQGLGGAVNHGKKWIRHDVEIEVVNSTHNPSADELNFYDTLDSIRTQFRANQSLAGNTLRFGEHIAVRVRRTKNANTVFYRALVRSQALEEITG